MKTLIAIFIGLIPGVFAQAPVFKEVTCWNQAGKQVLKLNAQKILISDKKIEIFKKESADKGADYTVVNATCVMKKL